MKPCARAARCGAAARRREQPHAIARRMCGRISFRSVMPKPLIKIGAVVAFVAGLGLYFWWSMRVPPPREQDRVVHRDGTFSIIKPRDWEASFNYAPREGRYADTLELRIPTAQTRDLRMFVGRFRAVPDLASIQARDKQ